MITDPFAPALRRSFASFNAAANNLLGWLGEMNALRAGIEIVY